MADDNVAIKWTADFGDVDAALVRVRAAANESFQSVGAAAGEAAESVKRHGKEIEKETLNIGESLEGMKKQLKTAFEAAGIIAAYEAVEKFKEELDEAAERAEHIKQMSTIIGTTTTEMQGLQAAAAEAGVDSSLLERGLMKVTQMMVMARDGSKTDAEALAKVGITSADLTNKAFSAADALYAIANSGAQAGDVQYVLGQRAALLATAFDKLKGGQAAMEAEAHKLHSLNSAEIETLEDYKERMAALGIEVDNVKGKTAAYLINAATPMLQGLHDMFAGSGQAVDGLTILKGALAAIETVVLVVANGFAVAKDVIVANVQIMTTAVVALGRAVWDALHGRFSAAKSDITTAMQTIKETIVTTGHAIANASVADANAISAAWTAAMNGVEKPKGPEERAQTGGGGTGAGAAAAQAAALKAQQEVLRAQSALAKDNEAATKHAFAEANKDLAEMVAQARISYQEELNARINSLTQQEAAVKQATAMGKIGPAEELAQLRTILSEKYAAQLDYYNKLKSLSAGNVVATAKVNADMVKAHQQYVQQMDAQEANVTKKIYAEWDQTGKRIAQGWSQSITKMMQGTMSLQQFFRATAQKIVEGWITSGTQMVAHTLTSEAAKQAAFKATGTVQQNTQAQASQHGLATSGMAALKSVMNSAYEAAAGAFKAVVGIPYVGPILAPAAAATAFTAVAAFQSGIASAAGGYEVPSDQLAFVHKNEMILPAAISAGLRGLIAGGGSGGHVTHNYGGAHVNMLDATGLRDLVSRASHRSALADALAGHYRRGGRL